MDERAVDAALASLPEWQVPPGFAARVAARAARQETVLGWIPLLLRGLGIAACVSVAAWLGAELLYAALSAAGTAGPVSLSWALAAGSLLLAWMLVRRSRLARITS